MKKSVLMILVIIFITGLCFGYTGIPDFLPYGVNAIGAPRPPGWISQKVDPNGFQGCYYYDATGNYHEGRGNPILKTFYKNGPAFDINSKDKKARIDKIEKMLKWLCKSFSQLFKIDLPKWWK